MKDEMSTIIDMDQMRRQGYEQEDAIDLSGYIATIVKRKKIVLFFFAAAILAAASWFLLAPKAYEISMLIGPPVVAGADGGMQDLDVVASMKAQIEANAFNEKVLNELSINEGLPRILVNQPPASKLIKVSVNVAADKTEFGKKALTALTDALNQNYAQSMDDKRSRIENQIKLSRIQIVRKENEIRLRREQIEILKNKEQQCLEDLKQAKSDSDRFLTERARVSAGHENLDAGTALVYVTTVQQSMGYFSQLKNELSETKSRKESLLSEIENLKSGINEDKIGIENLKLSEDAMHNIIVIQRPLVSSSPVGAGKARLMIVAAGVAGLIFGLFSALTVEYLEKFAA